jgi:hypothetical protein
VKNFIENIWKCLIVLGRGNLLSGTDNTTTKLFLKMEAAWTPETLVSYHNNLVVLLLITFNKSYPVGTRGSFLEGKAAGA